jgi:hypothetical protein
MCDIDDNFIHLLPAEIHERLNEHGVYFKKRVLHELMGYQGLSIAGEEVGESFGKTRVADILAFDERADGHKLFFVIECKRALAREKAWIFFRDVDKTYRVARASNSTGLSTISQKSEPHLLEPPVCSEGYEYPVGRNKLADQGPVFDAANQLSGAFLGFIRRRLGLNQPAVVERFIPVLVTTAKLLVVNEADASKADLLSGNLNSRPDCLETEFVILKHPFATPEGLPKDFRDEIQGDSWTAMHRESIYVVRASGLKKFFEITHRDFLHDALTNKS